MFSKLKNLNKTILISIIPGIGVPHNPHDVPAQAIPKNPKETGWDRLYYMFSKNELGEPSPEMVSILQVMFASMFVGGAIGGFIHSRNSFVNFVENNDASRFTSHMEAKTRLQDKVTIGFARGAYMWAWRLTAFTGCYTLLSTTISVYRGKTGIIEHTAGGLITGALYKSNIGLRGIVVGGVLGAVLGTLSGLSITALLALSGRTMDDVRSVGFELKMKRDSCWNTILEQAVTADESEVAKEHDKKIGHNNPTLDEVKI